MYWNDIKSLTIALQTIIAVMIHPDQVRKVRIICLWHLVWEGTCKYQRRLNNKEVFIK